MAALIPIDSHQCMVRPPEVQLSLLLYLLYLLYTTTIRCPSATSSASNVAAIIACTRSSSDFAVKNASKLNIPQKTHPRTPILKAAVRPPSLLIIAATNTGPSPRPKSSNVLNNAKACPLVVGAVTFWSVAFTIGPVTPLPRPLTIATIPIRRTGVEASTLFKRYQKGKQPKIAAEPASNEGYFGCML